MSVFNSPAYHDEIYSTKVVKLLRPGSWWCPALKTYSTVEFVSPTEAYASVAGGLAKVIKFNPTTMERTGEIDLSPSFALQRL